MIINLSNKKVLSSMGAALLLSAITLCTHSAQINNSANSQVESTSQQKPLLQEGKTSIYQRVLTTPSCEIKPTIEEAGTPIPAFSRYYTYEIKTIEDKTWLKVGPDSYGNISGWLDKNCTVDWKMQITLALTNPAGREPLLFYKDKETLEGLYESTDPKAILTPFYDALANGTAISEVLAKEPETMIDQSTQFYLLPVLESDEIYTEAGFVTRLLNVASVSKNSGPLGSDNEVVEKEVGAKSSEPNQNTRVPILKPSNTVSATNKQTSLSEANESTALLNSPTTPVSASINNAPNTTQSNANRLKGFSASVVFVIDSTISMGPYIDKTKQVVNTVYKEIEQANMLDQVKFGLVSFRSNTTEVPGLEWTAKMFANPNSVKDGADFLSKVSTLKEATVSSTLFDEDPYAGVMMALENIDWTEFGARYIVLITDAGAIEGDNKLSSTKLDAAQIRQEAKRRGVALYTLHLKSKSGKDNHAKAETQYTELTLNDFINKSLYYPIGLGDVNEFGQKITSLSQAIKSQIQLAYEGEKAIGSAVMATESAALDNKNDPILEDTALLGHAMQLAYLGKIEKTQAPPIFQAWISDRDIIAQSKPTVEVQVLLTKSELSDMSDVLTKIVNAANEGLISPEDMFKNLRDLAATMGKDPALLQQGNSKSLSDLGLLGEYLDDLPYLSEVLSLDEETWKSWDGLEQEKFIRRLNTKINYYKKYNEDTDRWIPLAKDSDPRDYVYPVPLENLP
ncbi:vWA domain-containing protein [Thorsellia kenyensis]|uniref:VWA domain-containing protein n=1 Tax=Thorsellia kenyensis TaxID=1549888 RepID=A0ABV6CC28_9GAMM